MKLSVKKQETWVHTSSVMPHSMYYIIKFVTTGGSCRDAASLWPLRGHKVPLEVVR